MKKLQKRGLLFAQILQSAQILTERPTLGVPVTNHNHPTPPLVLGLQKFEMTRFEPIASE